MLTGTARVSRAYPQCGKKAGATETKPSTPAPAAQPPAQRNPAHPQKEDGDPRAGIVNVHNPMKRSWERQKRAAAESTAREIVNRTLAEKIQSGTRSCRKTWSGSTGLWLIFFPETLTFFSTRLCVKKTRCPSVMVQNFPPCPVLKSANARVPLACTFSLSGVRPLRG